MSATCPTPRHRPDNVPWLNRSSCCTRGVLAPERSWGLEPVASPLAGAGLSPLVGPPGRLVEQRDPGVRVWRIGSSLHRPTGDQPAGCFDPLVGCSHTPTASTERDNRTNGVGQDPELATVIEELAEDWLRDLGMDWAPQQRADWEEIAS